MCYELKHPAVTHFNVYNVCGTQRCGMKHKELRTHSAQIRETDTVSGLQGHANRTDILGPRDNYRQIFIEHCVDQAT